MSLKCNKVNLNEGTTVSRDNKMLFWVIKSILIAAHRKNSGQQ